MADELIKVAEDSVRGSVFLTYGSVLATFIMSISSILVGRLLGPEMYGLYSLAFVVPQLLFLFADLGINQGIMKFASSLRTKGETYRVTRLIQYGILLRVLIGTAIFTVNFAFADLFALLINRPEAVFYIRLAAISIIFQALFATVNSAFIGLDRTEYNVLTSNMHALGKTLLSVALVLLGLGITGAILGQVAGYVIASIIGASIIFLRLLKPVNKLIPSQRGSDGNGFIQHLRILISYGMPLYISILLWGFLPLYQSVVLSFFTTDADIGNLKAAANFLTLLTVLSTPITTVLLPAFAKLDSSATDTIKVFFKLANKYASLVMIPATVLVIVFSREIVHIIYGSTFQPASLFLSINSLLYFLVGIGHLTLTSLFNGLGETRITLKVTIINFLIFIILAPILTMIYGVPGAIIASLISNTAGTSYAAYIGMIKFKIGFEKYTLLKIYLIAIISSIPPLLLFHLTSPQELFKISIGGLLYIFVYVTLIPLAKIVSRPELQKVSYVIKKIKMLNLIARPILKYMERISNYGAKT